MSQVELLAFLEILLVTNNKVRVGPTKQWTEKQIVSTDAPCTPNTAVYNYLIFGNLILTVCPIMHAGNKGLRHGDMDHMVQ